MLAMSSLVWVAIDQFGLSPEEMLNLFFATALGAGVVIGFAAIVVTLLNVLRKLRGKQSD